jgi:hypothetical protein
MPGMLTAVWGGGRARAPAAELATLVATCRWPEADELRFPSGFYSRNTPPRRVYKIILPSQCASPLGAPPARCPVLALPGRSLPGESGRSRRLATLAEGSRPRLRVPAWRGPSIIRLGSSSLHCHGAACILGSAEGHVAHRLTGAWVWVCEKERLASRARGGLV